MTTDGAAEGAIENSDGLHSLARGTRVQVIESVPAQHLNFSGRYRGYLSRHGGSMPSLTCQIDSELKARFVTAARAKGLCEAQLLRQILLEALPAPDQVPADGHHSATRRMTIRVPGPVHFFVEQAAKAAAVPSSRWVAMLLVSQATRTPQLVPAEWIVVEECSRQINALGRNLNQIARALHAGFGYHHDPVLLGAVMESVAGAQHAIANAFAATRTAWGTDEASSVP